MPTDDLYAALTEQLAGTTVPASNGQKPAPFVPAGAGDRWGLGGFVEDPVDGWADDPGAPGHLAVEHFPTDATAARFDPKESRYQRDPVAWARERLGVELWSKQRLIIESVRDHERTAVHTCHTIGKSFSSAVTVLWWIDVHPPGTAFVVTSAPTAAQVRAILWREINRMHSRGRLPGRVNLTSEMYLGSELVAMGRKPPDYDENAFQGIHARFVLVVFDEACGIPRQMWNAASTLVSNEESRFLAIGNPDDPNTVFGEVCGASPKKTAIKTGLEDGEASGTDSAIDPSRWSVIHVGAKDTPNFTGEEVSEHVSASLVSQRWVAERAVVWGTESAIYKSKVDGLFGTDVDSGVIPYSWAALCQSLELPEGLPVTAGLDVAGGGADRTVLRERRGARAGREKIWAGDGDTVALASDVARTMREWGVVRVTVDAIGVGHGMVSELKRISTRHQATARDRSILLHDAEVVPFKASESPSTDEYLNARAELYWRARELSRLKLWDLSEVDADVLAELTASRYEIVVASSKIQIEKKADLKKRIGASPDRAEALLLAFWERSQQANLPVPAKIFTETRWDGQPDGVTMIGPGKSMPTAEEIAAIREERAAEEAALHSLLADRILTR